MTIEAKIIADSISPEGKRLTTMQLRYPRFIHAEFMTHRMFSRNASSSRAIPVKRMIEDLRRDPAMPIHWGSNKPGMQAGEQLDPDSVGTCQSIWLDARDDAIRKAEWLMKNGLHKQIANRILEPWAHINVVVTATDWANFFALRRHEDAQPEIKALADAMWEAMENSLPWRLQHGEWHLPYANHAADFAQAKDHLKIGRVTRDQPQYTEMVEKVLLPLSVARCASVSYTTVDGLDMTMDRALSLYDRLLGSQPLHASPAEHQATPDSYASSEEFRGDLQRAFPDVKPNWTWNNPKLHGNFHGWIQYRKTLAGENTPG